MIEISYNTRVLVNNKGQVVIRVRWNNKKNEVGLSIGCSADPAKWDSENQRARYNTTHKVNNKTIIARDINNQITFFLDSIKEVFLEFQMGGAMPMPKELKELINEKVGRCKEQEAIDEVGEKPKEFSEVFQDLLTECSKERSWTESVHHKYVQAWNQLNSCVPNITLEDLNKKMMNRLKE